MTSALMPLTQSLKFDSSDTEGNLQKNWNATHPTPSWLAVQRKKRFEFSVEKRGNLREKRFIRKRLELDAQTEIETVIKFLGIHRMKK